MSNTARKVTTAVLVLGAMAMLGTCGDDGGNNNAAAGTCATNVVGCDPAAFSCDQAQRCYQSAADCQASGECGGRPGNPNPGGSCTTNVVGCDPAAFSCDQAQRCYQSAADCQATGECP